ncbi:MAG: ATP/GTP-binding protein [Actinocatenispora sp.]
MVSANSPDQTISTAKLVVAGGFGVGKTTLVRSISEIPPVNTEAWMTAASAPVDPLDPGLDKQQTTVAMDFGRRQLAPDLVLYLFGTPGQARFWPMWDDLCRGASGALVLVDTRRLDTSFAAVNYFENDNQLPFVVAVNLFHGERYHDLTDVRDALQLAAEVPLLEVDARDPRSVAQALMAVVTHSMRTHTAEPRRRPAPTPR